jgi:polysaccharide export outer membrane protein
MGAWSLAGQMQDRPAAMPQPAAATLAPGVGQAAGLKAMAAAPGYQLGPGDRIVVRVTDVEQFGETPVPVDIRGSIRLPMTGRMEVGGMTVGEVEAEITRRLKAYYLKPDVTVYVAEYRSQPVSVLGAVKAPGVYQVQGQRTLAEVLSLAGGLEETAGPAIQVTRRLEYGRIPVAGAADDETGKFSVARIPFTAIVSAKDPALNIAVMPHDVVTVPKADLVYVIGTVHKPGGFVVGERGEMSVLQALSMAGGLQSAAKPQESRILRRPADGGARMELAVDLKKMLDGRLRDMPMQPEDILFVPDNVPKKAALRAIEASVQTLTGVIIWRR